MKYSYFKNDDVETVDLGNIKFDLMVPCKPARVLAVFKNTSMRKPVFTVIDYATGLCIKHFALKREAKDFMDSASHMVADAMQRAQQKYKLPEINLFKEATK